MNWLKPESNDVNPHTFTTDFEDGHFFFYRGSHRMALSGRAVEVLIDGDDFYGNVDKLLKISKDPVGFADDIAAKLNGAGLFVRVLSAEFSQDSWSGTFRLDLGKIGLEPEDTSKPLDAYKFAIVVSPHDLDYQNVIDKAVAAFHTAAGNRELVPAL